MNAAPLSARCAMSLAVSWTILIVAACPASQHGAPCEGDADCGLEYLCQSGFCLRPELLPDPALDEEPDPAPEPDPQPEPDPEPEPEPDGGQQDPDGGQLADAGQHDAGATNDGGQLDAGASDAGMMHLGDAGPGPGDGGAADDAGPGFDAGPACEDVPLATRAATTLQPVAGAVPTENFGQAMDANEGRLVVSDPETARVFIYEGSAGAFNTPPGMVSGDAGDRFGWAVTTAADVVVVTAPTADAVNEGGVLVYRRASGGGDWELSEELVCAGADSNTYLGATASMREVSADKYVLLVGAYGYPQAPNDDAGAVCVWTYDASTEAFAAQAPVLRADPTVAGNFGAPLALSDDGAYLAVRSSTAIVDSFATGEVFLYAWDNATNTYDAVQTLTPDPYTLPVDGLYDAFYESWFGQGLDFAGDTLFVGASGWLASGQDHHGAVYEFERDAGGSGLWSHTDTIASPGATFFGFGGAVAADDDILVVGTGPWFSYDTDRAAFVYRRGCDRWSFEESLQKDDTLASYDRFSDRVHLTADHIIVGNHNEADATDTRVGAVRVYPRVAD